jgi:hypothetical protein
MSELNFASNQVGSECAAGPAWGRLFGGWSEAPASLRAGGALEAGVMRAGRLAVQLGYGPTWRGQRAFQPADEKGQASGVSQRPAATGFISM